METPNTDMLRGRVDIFVLKALSEKDGYGYDILNYIQSRTEGHYEMKQSSIYSVLKRLEKQEYVYSYMGDETNGAKRRYYSLTDTGRKFLENEEKEWAYTRTLLDNLVSDKNFDLKSDTPPFQPSALRPLTKRSTGAKEETVPVTESTLIAESAINNVSDETLAAAPVVTAESPEDPVFESNANDIATAAEEILKPNINSQINGKEQYYTKTAATLLDEKIYLSSENNINVDNTDTSTAKESPIRRDFSVKDNYRDFFGGLFNTQKQATGFQDNTVAVNEIDKIDCSHINDLRSHLEDEGIKLKTYEPTASGKGLMRYVLVNKLFRDSVLLSYLFLVAMLLVVYLCKPFGVALNAILIISGIALIAPIAALLCSMNNPDKKKKDNINIKIVMAVSFIIYLAFFIINVIITLIIPNGNSLNSAATYAPCVVCLAVPMFGIFFAILYSTNNYHLKNK